MIAPPVILERWERVAPFGVRFWDGVTRSIVRDGLRVSAVHADHPGRTLRAVPNRSGVYVIHAMPGFDAFGAGDDAFWERVPPSDPYVVTVEDTWRRFLPLRFTATLPVRGLFVPACLPTESPPSSPPDAVPLFSTTARAVAGGMAVLHADLWDAANERPAAWAVLELSMPGMPSVRGMADAGGRVALPFAYPEPPTPAVTSPGNGGRRALAEISWSLSLAAFYAPQTPVPAAPDLCDALAQPAAQLWEDADQTQAVAMASLDFGRPIVLRTQLPPDFAPQGVTLITST